MYKYKARKTSNRNRILECIFRNAPVSRTTIAELTEITPATTTTTISALLAEGIVIELGEEPSDEVVSGRKRIALDINENFIYSIGIEFNQKALCIVIANLKGLICFERTIPFSSELGSSITQVIIEELGNLMEQSGIPIDRYAGIGIAVPGHMDQSQSKLISNHNVWSSFDPNAVKKAFSLPVVLENNARCMALGQYLFHPAVSPDNFAFFHVGLGMFCANIVDDELFLGNAYVSGEIGHTIVNPDGLRCECGKYGCLQTIASERRLLQNARLLYKNSTSTVLRHLVACKEEINITHITDAYTMGDEVMGAYLSKALKYLGIATSNIAILMNPEKIFLHGQMFDCPEVRTELMDVINRQLLFVDNESVDTVEVLPFSPYDGAVGGGALAILRCFLQVNPNE